MFKRFNKRLKEPDPFFLTDTIGFDPHLAIHLSSFQEMQLLDPPVKRLLVNEFNLGELASRLCPALLADGTVTLFAIEQYSVGDAINTLALKVKQQGYAFAQPNCYVLSVGLLLALTRDPDLIGDSITLGGPKNHTPWSQADLFNAFLDIVRWGVVNEASDIHINVLTEHEYSEVRFSIAGRYICPPKFQGISTQFLLDILSVAWMSIRGGNGAIFDPYKEQQGSLACDIDGQPIMLRWGALAAELGPSVCLRILQRTTDHQLPSLDQLGYLPEQQLLLEKALFSDGGAVVFSGAVGSGKSTTLAAMVAALPAWRKVISIEDPVEYLIPNAVQVSLSRDLNQEAHDAFATKLRALKRSAMSDVLLGEIRDVETGRAFTDLSSSGVRLYTTVHAASAALVPARLNSDFIGVSMDLLSAPTIIRLLVHQSLLPRLCPLCAQSITQLTDYPPHYVSHLYKGHAFSAWRQRLIDLVGENAFLTMKVRQIDGCEYCRQEDIPELAGWQGRIVCAEILDPALIPGYFSALQQRSPLMPILQKAKWPDIRYSALKQAQRGHVDPFDIESHFSLFSASSWQQVLSMEPLYA